MIRACQLKEFYFKVEKDKKKGSGKKGKAKKVGKGKKVVSSKQKSAVGRKRKKGKKDEGAVDLSSKKMKV